MAPTFVAASKYYTTNQIQTWQVQSPSGTLIGDRLIMCVGTYDSATPDETFTITGGSGGTWNQVTDVFAANRHRLTVFERAATGADLSATFTVSLSYQFNQENTTILAAYRNVVGVTAGTSSNTNLTEVNGKYRHYMPAPSSTNVKNTVLYFSKGYAGVSGGPIARNYSNITGLTGRISAALGTTFTTTTTGDNSDVLLTEYATTGTAPAANSLYVDSDDTSGQYQGFGANSAIAQVVLVGNLNPTAPTNVSAGAKVGTNVPISWTHNDPDADPQSKYKFRWRKVI